MNRNDERFDELLDRSIEEIRRDDVDHEVVEKAADRVWARLSQEQNGEVEDASAVRSIRTCADFRNLIPAYLQGRLSEDRTLLLEDHTSECIPCRRSLKSARSDRVAQPASRPGKASRRGAFGSPLRWAMAASLVIGLLLVVAQMTTGIFTPSKGSPIRIVSLEGTLYNVTDDGPTPVGPGATFANAERIRTAKDSRAVIELNDRSLVELNQRSELYVTERRGDATVNLTRGDIIVEASQQGSGHLFTKTDDCTVSVTGTVFAVTRGMRGSRVSVIEGEVHVEQGVRVDILHSGDQITTNPGFGMIPIAQEIAWSGNLDQHLTLLKELSELRREMSEALSLPGLRHSTRLLDLAPENTVIYAAFPNIADTLDDAHHLLMEKVATSTVLRSWWQQNMVDSGAEPKLTEAIKRISAFGEHLGDEIAITLQADPGGNTRGPVLLAEVKHPGGFRDLLSAEVDSINAANDTPVLRLVDDPFKAQAAPQGHQEMLLWPQDDLLVVSPRLDDLRHMASLAGSPEASRLAGSSFHQSLAQVYREGTSIVFGADMEALIGRNASRGDAGALEALGLSDLRHLIVERHDTGETSITRASLNFSQERRGLAAWLAEPAPMAALDFISADASAAAAFTVKDPSSLLTELFGKLAGQDEKFMEELEKFQSEYNVNLIRDIAGPLGGEIALALDGPVLPKPAWKLIMEVYDQAGFQKAMQWAVQQINDVAEQEGNPGLSLMQEEGAGRTYYTLASEALETSIHYTFTDGYVLVAPQRVLLDRAIQIRRTGNTLPSSSQFTALLPKDGRANFSAVVYQNLGPLMDPILQSGLAKSAPLTPEQRASIDALSEESLPSLFYAYGERDRIVIGGSDRGGLLGSNLGSLFSFGTIMSLQNSIRHAAESHEKVYDGQDL